MTVPELQLEKYNQSMTKEQIKNGELVNDI